MTPRKSFIRPEDAQSMLWEATPGPWQVRGDGPSSGQPHFYICTCEDRTHVAENVYYGNARLLTYAPDMAEQIASMHYEYAVQKLDGHEWKLTDLDGRALESYEYEKVTWWSDPIPQSDIADRGPGWRIVRRLVSDPEVAE